MSKRKQGQDDVIRDGMPCSRRDFLLISLALLSGCDSGSDQATGAASGRQSDGWWLQLSADPAAMVLIGKVYLDSHADENNAAQLHSAIDSAVKAHDPRGQSGKGVTDYIAALRRAILDDYRQARYELIDGWVLSRTEAQVYALQAALA